eukprot:tig00000431_g690.t1
MAMADSNNITVTVDILNHIRSKQLSTDYRLTCNDTSTARTMDIELTGPSTVTITALQPSTTYSCWAKTTSSAGDSQDSNTASATTDDSPRPTLTTTAVNATAVWLEVELPTLDPVVNVTGVRISRAMSSAAGSEWTTVAMVPTADSDGVYRHVDAGRAHQTDYWYKAVYLTPADSKESESKQARTGPPAPQLSLGYKTEFDLRVDLAETDLNKLRVSETFLLRNSSRVCSEASDNWLASCVDGTGAINPGITYEYTAQYEGLVFYNGLERNERGLISDPLHVTALLVVKPTISYTLVTATTAKICVTYPRNLSHAEIKTTEFSRLYLPTSTPNTFSIPKEDEFEDCIMLTGLEPATTSNITAYYTTTGLNSPTSDVLQVTQASPAAPKLYVSFEPAYPNATAVKVQVVYRNEPADPEMQTSPAEDLLPVIKRIDLYRNGSLVGSQGAVSTLNTYEFIDDELAPGLLYYYQATLFTLYTNSPNGSALAETDIAARPKITATGIDRNTSAITLVVDRPVPEQAAAVTIRIYRAPSVDGTYQEIAEINSKPEPEGDYVYTDTARVAGTQYWYKADYTTSGEPDGIAGKDSDLSDADGAWTAPSPPAFSLNSATVTGSSAVTVSLHMAPSVANSSVTGLVVSRDSFSFSCSAPNPIGWLGGVGGTATCVDTGARPATLYTYTAHYIGQEGLTSERAHFNVTTPPEAPLVVKGPYRATTSTISVEIELPVGWEKSNGTELYRDGAGSSPIVTIPLSPSSCGPCHRLDDASRCCLRFNDTGLAEGRAYNYTALLTVDNGGVRVTSPESAKKELWTALPAPVPVIHASTNYPSVTVNVSLPLGLESVVVRTVCWANASAVTFTVSGAQFVVSSEDGATGYKVDWATAYVWKCVFEGQGGTRSEVGDVAVTLPPKAPS